MQSIEPPGQDFVKQEKHFLKTPVKGHLCQTEIIIPVQYIQIGNNLFVCHFFTAHGNTLIQQRKGIPHGSVCLLGYDAKRIPTNGYPFFFCYLFQVMCHCLNRDTVEIKDLASGKNGGEDFVFFGCGQNE